MAAFGRSSARRQLRAAAHQPLSVPAFDGHIDCTPWVIGGLWPAELETVTPRTATTAEYLKNDLQRIAHLANERIRNLHHRGLADRDRHAEEARIVEVARAFAVLRVESTVRQLHDESTPLGAEPASVTAEPESPAPPPFDATELIEFSEEAAVAAGVEAPTAADGEGPDARLARLLHFVARQQPGLRWAVGDRADGATVLATDLAHGWIPPGVLLPADVDVLPPAQRDARVRELLGDVVRSAVYQPGDPFGGASYEATVCSTEARRLPAADDLIRRLSEATQHRHGLPRIVHTLATACAARTAVLDAEIDVLRVHSDTARYELLARYPDVDPSLLSNCLLLAAVEAMATGDELSANYHFSWFEVIDAPAVS